MTGRWPYQQGVIDNKIPLSPDEMTLGKAFQAAGYHTAYIGKWHLGGVRAEPFGFDRSLIWTGTNTHWDRGQFHPREGGPVQPKGYNATLMTDQALAYLDERAAGDARPFFMMLSWNPPHSDFLDPPAEKRAMYPEGSLAWRDNVAAETRRKPTGTKIWNKNGWPSFRGYHAHISAIDDELGRLMAKLDELGLADHTILVYSSDHGTMMGSHKLGRKAATVRRIHPGSVLRSVAGRHPRRTDLRRAARHDRRDADAVRIVRNRRAGRVHGAGLLPHPARRNGSDSRVATADAHIEEKCLWRREPPGAYLSRTAHTPSHLRRVRRSTVVPFRQ